MKLVIKLIICINLHNTQLSLLAPEGITFSNSPSRMFIQFAIKHLMVPRPDIPGLSAP